MYLWLTAGAGGGCRLEVKVDHVTRKPFWSWIVTCLHCKKVQLFLFSLDNCGLAMAFIKRRWVFHCCVMSFKATKVRRKGKLLNLWEQGNLLSHLQFTCNLFLVHFTMPSFEVLPFFVLYRSFFSVFHVKI